MDNKLSGKKAIIIGATGQDGQIMVKNLNLLKVSVVGVSKNQSFKNKELHGVDYRTIDLSNKESAFEFLDSIKPDFIFHLGSKNASSKSMKQIENTKMSDIVNSTINLTSNLLAWQLNNHNTEILVGLSCFMYSENPESNVINLGSDYSPKGVYGECNVKTHKLIVEHRAKYGSNVSGLILFNHTSRYSKKGFLIPDLVKKINKLRKNKVNSIIVKEANKLIDISDANNFCEGFIKIIELGLVKDFIFSAGKLVTIKSIVEESINDIDPNLLNRIDFINAESLPMPICGNISATVGLLQWNPTKSIKNTLLDMLK